MFRHQSIFIKLGNKYISWSKAAKSSYSLWIRGYIFVDGQYYSKETLADYLSSHFDKVSPQKHKAILNDLIPRFNGNWALVYKNKEIAFASVDRLRSTPLFYGIKDNKFYLGDDANGVREQITDSQMDEIASKEFLLTGYVTGPETLFPNVKQLQAGVFHHFV